MPSLFSVLRDVFRQLRVAYNAWRVQVKSSLQAQWLHDHVLPLIPQNLPLSSERRRTHDHKAVVRGRLERDYEN